MDVKASFQQLKTRFCEKTGWKIIDSYILKKFLGSVVFSIALLMTIVVVFDVSENIQRFMDKSVPLKEIITDYYLNFIPYSPLIFSTVPVLQRALQKSLI